MKRLIIGLTSVVLLTSQVAIAQPYDHRGQRNENQQTDDHRGQRGENQRHDGGQWHEQSGRWDNGRHRGWGHDRGNHYGWRNGQQMGYNDWNNASRIDYRRYHLRQPPRGYEWRRHGDRYVLAAVATGIIVSVILSNQRRRY